MDAEQVSKGWEEDIKLPPGSEPRAKLNETDSGNVDAEDDTVINTASSAANQGPSAIAQYEEWCRDPNTGGLAVVESAMSNGTAVNVDSEEPQGFLERQLKILEAYKAKVPEKAANGTGSISTAAASRRTELGDDQSVNEHIGPVQFNMGGIQVDADDMLQRLKVSRRPPFLIFVFFCPFPRAMIFPLNSLPWRDLLTVIQDRNAHTAASEPGSPEEDASGNMTKEYDNEQLQNFFSGLMNRTAGAADSPRS